jgi:leucyl-tRNA synthetase
MMGYLLDWNREINTTDPEYYRWTQWIFLKLYDSWYCKTKQKAEPINLLIKMFAKEGNENINAACSIDVKTFTSSEWKMYSEVEKQNVLMKYRLAYEGFSEVNWCPQMGTVLANDEIIPGPDGKPVSERGGYPVEKKLLRQWFLRITAYADRLIAGLEGLEWSGHIKEIQKNWIGKSVGSEIEFAIKVVNPDVLVGAPTRASEEKIKVFTTRADTLFGVTYVVLAPEADLVKTLLHAVSNKKEVEQYILEVKSKTDEDRLSAVKEKTGVKLEGIKAINPANLEEVPVFLADYVLANYGTGMVMAVPAHDERDYAFASKYNLPIKEVISGGDITREAYIGNGKLVNSGKFDGMENLHAINKITSFVFGKFVTRYKMRDAVFARQRYWGEPIPLIHKKDGTITPVAEIKLPLKLPNVISYEPIGTGESPLAGVKEWVAKGYETNTMPGWAGSSWYFLRYMDPKNKTKFVGPKANKYWKQVDMYVGGAEHATGHLLYSRFWNKFLFDYGYITEDEPFKCYKNLGMILGSDNRKMSKRWGNVINPDDVVKNVGADTLRVYESFMGPFDQEIAWSTDSMVGSRRFLERVWKLQEKVVSKYVDKENILLLLNQTIKKVEEDIESFNANTAISSMMILTKNLDEQEKVSKKTYLDFIKILSPFAPHIAEEIWKNFGNKKMIVLEKWPKYDDSKLISSLTKIVVQINGKVRATIEVPTDSLQGIVENEAMKNEAVVKWILNKQIIKKIFIKNKIINFVV